MKNRNCLHFIIKIEDFFMILYQIAIGTIIVPDMCMQYAVSQITLSFKLVKHYKIRPFLHRIF